MKKLISFLFLATLPLASNAQTAVNAAAAQTQNTATAITKTHGPVAKPKKDPQIIVQETPQSVAAKKAEGASETKKITTLLPYALNPQAFFENRVSVLVPSTFVNADDKLIKEQYPDPANYPKIVLTDNTRRPLMALNITADTTGDRGDIIHFFRDIKNDIRNRYPTSKFLKTDVIRNRTLGMVEVILPNKDGQNIYNMMAFRYIGNNFFFFNFSCPEEDMGIWQNSAREIVENIKMISPQDGQPAQ